MAMPESSVRLDVGSVWISTLTLMTLKMALQLFEMPLSSHPLLPPSPIDPVFLHWPSFFTCLVPGVLVLNTGSLQPAFPQGCQVSASPEIAA